LIAISGRLRKTLINFNSRMKVTSNQRDEMMSKYRYPGLRSFNGEDREVFFGRDLEVQKLFDLILLEKIVVLYGKSGYGKSSVVQAGLIPLISGNSDFTPLVIRFGSYFSKSSPKTGDIVCQQLKFPKGKNFLNKLIPDENSLWYHFKGAQQYGKAKFILFFDQFEEFFTHPESARAAFMHELYSLGFSQIPDNFRNAYENMHLAASQPFSEDEYRLFFTPIEVKIVFSIRSDKFSLLNELVPVFPNVLKRCFELKPLSRDNAEDCIIRPAELQQKGYDSPAFCYKPDALKKILDFLVSSDNNTVEAFQLQIICQYCEKKIIDQNLDSIGEDDLKSLESIYDNFYITALDQFHDDEEKRNARHLIEEGLIFEEEERRLSLYEGQIRTLYKVGKELLRKLVDARLLRAEPHFSSGFAYEICHDTMVKPILKAKKIRLEFEKRQAVQNQLAKQSLERKVEKNLVFESVDTADPQTKWQNMLGAFLSNLSHEFITPMNGILGFSQLLYEMLDNPDLKDMSSMIRQSGERLMKLLESLITYYELESNHLQAQNEKVDIHGLLSSVTSRYETAMKEKGLRFEYTLPPGELIVATDQKLLSRALDNLMDNAVKFTQQGSVTATVEKVTMKGGSCLKFSISDTGIGTDKTDIFDVPFRQNSTGMNLTYEGMGISLVSVKKIMGLLGGAADFESEPGKGSSFHLLLPYKSEEPIHKIADSLLAFKEKLPKVPRILIVEDDESSRRYMKILLNGFGLQDIAKDGEEAVKNCTLNSYDLILMDIQMPVMNGLEASIKIRDLPDYREVPIIVMTAFAMFSDRTTFMESVHTEYFLVKPINRNQLYEMIIGALENYMLRTH
jgi:signal transduction histidine kinase/ActR/RegA family two-component response regulator